MGNDTNSRGRRIDTAEFRYGMKSGADDLAGAAAIAFIRIDSDCLYHLLTLGHGSRSPFLPTLRRHNPDPIHAVFPGSECLACSTP